MCGWSLVNHFGWWSAYSDTGALLRLRLLLSVQHIRVFAARNTHCLKTLALSPLGALCQRPLNLAIKDSTLKIEVKQTE